MRYLSFITARRLIIVAVVLFVLFLIYTGISWYVVAQAREAEVLPIEQTPDELGMAYEDVTFSPRGDDSITLRGWWLPAEDAHGSAIWVHGLDKNRAEELDLLKSFVDAGYNVLTFDLRGHGESDKVPLGAGYFETNDVRGAIDYAVGELGVAPGKLVLVGRSFGAALALMVGYDEPAVAGVYADSSFDTLSHVLTGEVADRTIFPHWFATMLLPGIVTVGKVQGIDIEEVRPVDAVSQYDSPIGLSHCLQDERIPVEQSHALRQQVHGPVWYNLFPRCSHAEAYDEFGEQYVNIVLSYLDYVLEVPASATPTLTPSP